MSTTASGRLGVDDAPAGLVLVQDLLNTAPMPAFDVPDLLEEEGPAQAWLTAALEVWGARTDQTAPVLELHGSGLADLRDGRARTRAWLSGDDVDLGAQPVLVRTVGRRATYAPGADGARGVLGLVAAELLLAARDGSLARLKTCANPACGAAFYDLSRNSSRVWHDVKTCGNVTNLRASRARRRSAGGGAGAAPGDDQG